MKLVRFKAIVVAAMLLIAGLPMAAIAHEEDADTTSHSEVSVTEKYRAQYSDKVQNARERLQAVKLQAQERRENAKTRLDQAKLRLCQNRERAIQNIMARISDRGQRHLNLFTTIADRVKHFYEDKGLSAANYEELVANVEAKKAAAQATVDVLKSSDLTFDCEAEDPKATVLVFRDMQKDMIDALQAYRTSIKDLIVAVAHALGEADEE